ncbi:hypothetical protein C8E00_101606 [Chromohalobacter marismortui]|uniref:Uncharacterized protein n=1 Tax=Chromohalobacter marismortui TaxID=42055 RepID=A0A4R7NWK2_9GAMM|nr:MULTISPECIES: hypothetical protein [Chromohalobacter]MCI0511187.1 hypothetical protein [Chromohalobacter sp.]MCI0593577.1 hypothetical protein [Chromohalobacter sp.]TDU25212.1 hypothetical protein C8E00_101606 [Chromohalobacter marismortui]
MASLSLFLSILISAVALTAALTMLVYRWVGRRAASSGQPSRKSRGKSAPKRGNAASRKRSSRASAKTQKPSSSRSGLSFPRLPTWLRASLPLGMMLTLIAAVGQLALQGMHNAHQMAADDPRLLSLANVLDGISLLALVLLFVGMVAWLAPRQ